MATAKTIGLKAPGVREEFTASEAITPGHLVEFGGSNEIQKHSTAGGEIGAVKIAVENDVVGDDVDTDYVSGEQVQVDAPHGGAVYMLRLANGENVSKGDLLESAGDGTLQAAGTASSAGEHAPIVGEANEAVDMSGSSAADPSGKIEVRIR